MNIIDFMVPVITRIIGGVTNMEKDEKFFEKNKKKKDIHYLPEFRSYTDDFLTGSDNTNENLVHHREKEKKFFCKRR